MSASTRSTSRAPRALHGVEDHRARVAALAAAHEVGADPFGPQLELLGGCGAERVAGGHHDGVALGECPLRPTLPMVVVLPTPLTPTNSHTFGCAGLEVECPVAGEPLLDLVLHRVEQTGRRR